MGVIQASPHGVMNSAVPFPEWVDNLLINGTATSYTVPAAAGYALIATSQPLWGRVVTGVDVAAAPADNVLDGTGSFYIAAGMQCKIGSGKSISLVRATSTSAEVSIAVYHA